MPAPYPLDYPINWYSRIVTDSSGTSPSYQYFLTHADRALVSSGSVIVDHSSYNSPIYTQGSGIVQELAAGYFGTSGIAFTGSTALVDAARIGWTVTVNTLTSNEPCQVEMLFYFSGALDTGQNYALWEFSDDGHTDWGTTYIYNTAGQWRFVNHWFRSALGQFFSHEYNFTLTTGTWHHIALVRAKSGAAIGIDPGSQQIGLFLDSSQLHPVSGGFPTGGGGDWRNCAFATPLGPRFIVGGSFLSATGGNIYSTWKGSADEIRYLQGSYDGLAYNSVTLLYTFNVPTAPYIPLDVTTTETAKTLTLSSSAFFPVTDSGLIWGTSTAGWGSGWISGSSRLNFRNSTTYCFSSAAGYLTFVAGTQIDLQANIGVSAQNFIFDTATGVKFGTTTNVKMGFFGVSPIVQQSGNIVTALSNLGLVVSGTLGISDVPTVTTTSAAYTLTTGDEYLICESGTAFAVTLPAALGSYQEFMVKNIGSGAITVTANTADLIDSASTTTLGQWGYAKLLDYFPATTGVDASTVLALRFDNNLTDISPLGNTVTSTGSVSFDTANKQFGSASILFSGGTDGASRLSVGSRVQFYMGTQSVTIAFWYRPISLSGTTAIFSQWGGGGANGQFYIDNEAGTIKLYYSTDGSGETGLSTGITVTTGTLQYLSFTRVGTVWCFHKNGALTGTAAGNFTFNNSTLPVNISTYGDGSGQAINGNIDNLKWDINVARYTSASYTIPTITFGSDQGKWLLIT